MEELSLDNILTDQDISNLFMDAPDDSQEESSETPEDNKQDKDTTEANLDQLFDLPESVGSEDNKEDKEDTGPAEDSSSNTFSSIAKAFAEEGIFPDLEDDEINNVKSPEEFRALIEKQMQAGMDERYRRIENALNSGIQPDVIKQYEGVIQTLNSISENAVKEESDTGEELRRRLIYNDCINRGYNTERAQREVKKSFDGGTDIEDALDALHGAREFYKNQYNEMVEDSKKKMEAYNESIKKQINSIKKSILEDKNLLGELDLDKSTRQKIFDNLFKVVHRDKDTGEGFTAIRYYEKNNKEEFMKNLGIVYTLTDGFKNLNKLVGQRVNKEVKKGFKDLEKVINSSARNLDGSLRFSSGVDTESYIGKGLTLDI